MADLTRFKHQLLARFIAAFPALGRRWATAAGGWESAAAIPWTALTKPLHQCRLALVTTAGVHLRDQPPFDMTDPEGDATFRAIATDTALDDLTITHDYYDHGDADRDLNIVFPLERLRDLVAEGTIGSLAEFHYGFMGHIIGTQLSRLTGASAPEVARRLRADAVDVVLLTPA